MLITAIIEFAMKSGSVNFYPAGSLLALKGGLVHAF